MSTNLLLRTIFPLLIAILTLLSCKEEEQSAIKVFKYNQTDHITSLDPAFAKSQNNIWAVNHLFEGLVKLDDQLNVVPSLADSFIVSDSGLEYKFYLKEEIYFHKDVCFDTPDSTRAMVAEDVVYSLQRLLDANVNSPGSWLFKGKVDDDEPFVATDEHTFVMRLKTPFLPMLGIMTMQYCSVVPKEAVAYYGDQWAQHPVGTGPFRFKKWVENQALYLVKNSHYHDVDAVQLDGIKTTFIPDRKIAFLELMNGNLDFVSGLESSFAPTLLTNKGALKKSHHESLNFQKAPYLNMEYFGINETALAPDSPLRKKKFRQGLNYGIDRQLMLTALRNGVGKPADAGFIPRGLPAYDPSQVPGYFYDKDRAVKLMLESGYDNLAEVPVIELYTNKDYLDLTTFIAKQWEVLGLQVSIEVLESGLLRQGMRNGEIPFFRGSWIADYPDEESFLCMFYSEYPAPPNYTRYSNPEFDRLYTQAISTTNTKQRLALYQEMDRLLVDDAPVIFLFYDETALFSSSKISGISANAINLLKVDSLDKQL